MSPDELLLQLGELATSLGPAVRPAGTDELLRSLTETARRLLPARKNKHSFLGTKSGL